MKSFTVVILFFISFNCWATKDLGAVISQMPKVPQQTIEIVTDTTQPKQLKDEARVVKMVSLDWSDRESSVL